MKKILLTLLSVLMIITLVGCQKSEPAQESETDVKEDVNEQESREPVTEENGKSLVLYFSWSGNVDKFANIIASETGADIVRIEPVVPYSTDYNTVADYAKKERDNDGRPEIKTEINIDGYDVIFVGYPIWWYTVPMIIRTLLDDFDFSGKTIIPFNSHEGSGNGGTYDLIKQLEPQAEVLEGLAIRGRDFQNDQTETVRNWLSKLDY